MKVDTTSCPIVYVSPYYDPAVPSGANRRFNEICARLEEEFGDRFHLLITRGKRPEWWRGKNLIEINYRFSHLSKFAAARQIGTYLDTLPPSIVIVESIPIPYRALKRHAHFQVAYDFRYFRKESRGLLYRALFSTYLKQQWRKAEYMVTCSEFSIDELVRHVGYPRERVLKSYFGVDNRVFATPRPTRKVWDIIYVGHFEKRKNHEPLLRAIARANPNLKTLLIGVDNGLQASLEALVRELGLTGVVFETVNDDVRLWTLYSESKLFVYPSVYEGFGIPLIEALALSVPVAASDIAVFHEVGGEFVRYFDPYDPADIAQKILTTLEKPILPNPHEVESHLSKFFWKNIYRSFVDDVFKRATAIPPLP